MQTNLRASFILSALITILMVVQAVLGLLVQSAYHDVEWIKATWFGNDIVTLVVAVPLLSVALVLARQGSIHGLLLWLGLLGYSIYNYAFYLFGVALNVFFPLYIVAVVLSVAALILLLVRVEVGAMAECFAPTTPVRIVGGYLMFVAVTFCILWGGMWAAHVFAGLPTPTPEPEAFRLVAALDLTLMMPMLGLGGILLWRRHVWGFPIATLAAIQAALYLLVLTVNSALAITRGLAAMPGELPIWGSLLVTTTAAVVLLLTHVRPEASRMAKMVAGVRHRPTV